MLLTANNANTLALTSSYVCLKLMAKTVCMCSQLFNAGNLMMTFYIIINR